MKFQEIAGRLLRVRVAPPRGERGLKLRRRTRLLQRGRRSPSWGAWIEITAERRRTACQTSRSPSWGAWIEIHTMSGILRARAVAPPRGERGLKSRPRSRRGRLTNRRSPSWGAWIEIVLRRGGRVRVPRRSPSWGAWIEMTHPQRAGDRLPRRSPSWGAWIEIGKMRRFPPLAAVAPPRGERGLKYCRQPKRCRRSRSLPLVGSVD